MQVYSQTSMEINQTPSGGEIILRGNCNNHPAKTLRLNIVASLSQKRVSEVFHVKLDGQDLILKQFFGKNPENTVTTLCREQEFLSRTMFDGPYQVNRCLYAFPEIGVVLLEYRVGKTVGTLISSGDSAFRSEIVLKCGNWLKEFGAGRDEYSCFSPMFWINYLDKLDLIQDFEPETAALLDSLRQRLFLQAKTIAGIMVKKSALHDDFVGFNLIFNNDIICGIDIQTNNVLPYAKVAARFLTLLHISRPNRDPAQKYGISERDHDSFFASEVLPHSEYDTSLPFFIGEQIFLRLLESAKKQKDTHAIKNCAKAFLEDQSCLD